MSHHPIFSLKQYLHFMAKSSASGRNCGVSLPIQPFHSYAWFGTPLLHFPKLSFSTAHVYWVVTCLEAFSCFWTLSSLFPEACPLVMYAVWNKAPQRYTAALQSLSTLFSVCLLIILSYWAQCWCLHGNNDNNSTVSVVGYYNHITSIFK